MFPKVSGSESSKEVPAVWMRCITFLFEEANTRRLY